MPQNFQVNMLKDWIIASQGIVIEEEGYSIMRKRSYKSRGLMNLHEIHEGSSTLVKCCG